MALSAALTSIGGTLFAMYLRYIDPPTLFTLPEVPRYGRHLPDGANLLPIMLARPYLIDDPGRRDNGGLVD